MKTYIKEINHNINAINEVQKAMKYLRKTEVLAGIPQEESGRNSSKISNAQLAFIHNNGSPIQGIPARPFMLPALEKKKEEIKEQLKKASQNTANGNINETEKALNFAGMIARDAIKAEFFNNNWSPLKAATVKKRKNGGDSPLFDTGELLNSIHYVVRQKGD